MAVLVLVVVVLGLVLAYSMTHTYCILLLAYPALHCFCAGSVCSMILQQSPGHYGAMSGMGKALLEYGQHEQPTVKQMCDFEATVQKVLSDCQKLEGLPGWVKEGRLAVERFSLLLTEHAKKEWSSKIQSQGLADALGSIQKEKLTLSPDLTKCLSVLKYGKLLQELGSEPSVSLIQDVKNLFTIESLEIEDIKFFFPEVPEKVTMFRAQATTSAMTGLKEIEDFIKEGRKLLSDFRHSLADKTLVWVVVRCFLLLFDSFIEQY